MPKKGVASKTRMTKRSKRRPSNEQREIERAYYNGPVKIPGTQNAQHIVQLNLHMTGSFLSDGAGVIKFNALVTQVTSANDWTNLSASFEEYRVLALEVHYRPNNRYSKSTTICRPIISAVDHGSSASFASYADAQTHESARFMSLEDPHKRTWRMNDLQEGDFVPTTGAPSIAGGVKFYGDSVSFTIEYGIVFYTYLVEFRGTR